ncbi:MAG TPA: protease modulator HflC, partial [Alphaproteobacteria bacterium]|nr:protease modulator HflC [Alphaproteobacteria bacterium]
MNKISAFLLGGIALAGIIAGGVFFTVSQSQQAIVLRFGELTSVHKDPGLKLKLPFIEDVLWYEKRVLDFDPQPVVVTTADQKRLEVTAYTRYRIEDPVLFFQSIKPSTELGAQMRLDTIVSSSVRNLMGRVPLRNLLSEERVKVMHEILEDIKGRCTALGLMIVDVRIVRTELPPANRDAVTARMNAELDRIAKENRAKGMEIAQGIKARAEKEKTILLAEAQKKSEILRGEADAAATKI